MDQEQHAVEQLVSERALECVVRERHVVVPLRFVDQLIEYRRVPLPLVRAGVAGLGVYQGSLLISLSLDRAKTPAGLTKAVLLRALAPNLTFALEVDQTLSFVDLPAAAAPYQARSREPWLSHITSMDGRQVLRIDVESLVFHYLAVENKS